MQASSFAQVLGGPYDQFLLCSPTNLQSFHKTWHRPHTTPADFMSMSTALVESSVNLPSVQFLKLVFSSIVTCKMRLCWAHISYFSLREQLCSDTCTKISGKKCLPISLDQNQSLSKIHQIPNVFLQFLPYWQVFKVYVFPVLLPLLHRVVYWYLSADGESWYRVSVYVLHCSFIHGSGESPNHIQCLAPPAKAWLEQSSPRSGE